LAKNPLALDAHLSEGAFSKAESGMKIDKVGNGSFAFDLHGPSTAKPSSGRIQTPAQHASVKKAAAASVSKRRARAFGA
jgi:hypothetical protein